MWQTESADVLEELLPCLYGEMLSVEEKKDTCRGEGVVGPEDMFGCVDFG
jgi:hypothetical protein